MNIKRLNKVVVAFALLTVAGCSVKKDWLPVDGSRSDGTITVGYMHASYEIPVESGQQGASQAKKHCAGWGYSKATPFELTTTECIEVGIFDICDKWLVTKQYQCINPQDLKIQAASPNIPTSSLINKSSNNTTVESPSDEIDWHRILSQ